MIRKRFLFEVKIIISILTAVVIVVLIGWLAYKSMTDIIDNISEEARPDIKLAVLKNILSDLSDAESSVKSYSITGNNDYLTPFYNAISSIDDQINALSQLSRNEKRQQPIIDSISRLVEYKFVILNKMLRNQENKSRVAETLKRISDKLNEASVQPRQVVEPDAEDEINIENNANTQEEEEVETREEVPKENFFSKIFSKKNRKHNQADKEDVPQKSNIISKIFGKKNQETEKILKPEIVKKSITKNSSRKTKPTKDSIAENISSITVIKKEVTKIKKQEDRQALATMKEQLDLTRKDKVVMDKIRIFIAQLEREEKKAIAEKTIEAEQMADKANQMIALFCIVVSVLLLVLGYIIIGYTRKSSAYSKALKKAKVEAENLAMSKEFFLSNMSHEIRTPMNAIAGFTEQVLATTLKREQKEQLEIVKKSANHLLEVINDILDISKLGAGKLTLEKIHFNPHEVVQDVFLMMRPQATKKNVSIIYKIDENTPDVLIGDPMRLRQILINLLSNSIKFTDAGEISIHVAPILQNNEYTRLQISVSDTGIGIPDKKTSSIFNAFEQAEKSTTRKYGGTGLGLTITKKLIDLQDGTIHLRSQEGKGTVITFIIPYEMENSEETNRPKTKDINYEIIRDKKILVADDEEYNRILLSAILKKWGVAYTEVENGQEALDELSRNNYDVILMDVRMPVMNGMEASRYLRTKFKSEKSAVAILALTAAYSKEAVSQCLEAGMNDVLNKPFTERDLFEKILSILKIEDVIIDKEKPPSDFSIEKPSYNLTEIYNLSNGDKEFVYEMIEMFIRTTEDGLKEIRKGMNENSWDTVMHYSHKIASPCRHIEATATFQLLKEIEERIRESHDTKSVLSLVDKLEKETDILLGLLRKELAASLK